MTADAQNQPVRRKPRTAFAVALLVAAAACGIAAFLWARSNGDGSGGSAGQTSFFEMRQVIDSKGALGPAIVTAADVRAATAIQVPTGETWAVEVRLDQAGTTTLADVTAHLVDAPSPQNQLAMVVDGRVVSSPAVMAPITEGEVQITGNFTEDDAISLADRLAAVAG
jgi:preprotein translocase subunit SecD